MRNVCMHELMLDEEISGYLYRFQTTGTVGHWSSVTTGGNGKTRIQPEVFALCMCLPRESN